MTASEARDKTDPIILSPTDQEEYNSIIDKINYYIDQYHRYSISIEGYIPPRVKRKMERDGYKIVQVYDQFTIRWSIT